MIGVILGCIALIWCLILHNKINDESRRIGCHITTIKTDTGFVFRKFWALLNYLGIEICDTVVVKKGGKKK